MRDYPFLVSFEILRPRDFDRPCEIRTNLSIAGANIPDGLVGFFASSDVKDSKSLCKGFNHDPASHQMLAGHNFDDDSALHTLVLVGGEARRFISPHYRPQNTAIADAEVEWSPSGMTAVPATVSREPGPGEQPRIFGLVYTTARLTIGDEYLPHGCFERRWDCRGRTSLRAVTRRDQRPSLARLES